MGSYVWPHGHYPLQENYTDMIKDWLDSQTRLEKEVLDTVAGQVRGITDDLLPQIRLAAIENEMQSVIKVEIHFDFDEDNTKIRAEGSVQFPAKHTASETITL